MWVYVLGIGITIIAAVFGVSARKMGEKYLLYEEKELIRLYKRKKKIFLVSFILTFIIPIVFGFIFTLLDFRLSNFIIAILVIFVVTGSIIGTIATVNYFQVKKVINKNAF